MASAFLIVTKKKSKSCYSYVCTSYRHYPSLMRQLSLCRSIFLCLFLSLSCSIFQPGFGCCALQTLVELVIFCVFCAKKLKKQEIWSKILPKTRFSLYLNFFLFSLSLVLIAIQHFSVLIICLWVCLISRIFFPFSVAFTLLLCSDLWFSLVFFIESFSLFS